MLSVNATNNDLSHSSASEYLLPEARPLTREPVLESATDACISGFGVGLEATKSGKNQFVNVYVCSKEST